LEPEILLVDEVLAVGDQSFQRKCLERMKRLKNSGTTILLVSHNMAAIQSTCERSVLLDRGSISGIGATSDVLKSYRDLLQKSDEARKSTREASPEEGSSGVVRILGFEMRDKTGQSRSSFQFGEEVNIRIKLHAAQRIYSPLINFGIKRGDGVIVCNFNNWYDNFKIDYIEGNCTLEGWLPPLRLIPHYYEIHLLVWQRFKGAAEEGLSGLRPLTSVMFGNFSIDGPPMTDQDGVFQQPAAKWVLTREGERILSPAIDDHSLLEAFSNVKQQNT
jgi:lipopolysaccharide transport system ATP-binding protein